MTSGRAKGRPLCPLVRICLSLPALLASDPRALPAPRFFLSRNASRVSGTARAAFPGRERRFFFGSVCAATPSRCNGCGTEISRGGGTLFPATPRSFSFSLPTQLSPHSSFFTYCSPPTTPHPNFSNFSTGFFFPSLTTTPSHAIHLTASLLSCLSFSCLCYPLNESDDDD